MASGCHDHQASSQAVDLLVVNSGGMVRQRGTRHRQPRKDWLQQPGRKRANKVVIPTLSGGGLEMLGRVGAAHEKLETDRREVEGSGWATRRREGNRVGTPVTGSPSTVA